MLREKGQFKSTRIALAIVISLIMLAITGNNSWAKTLAGNTEYIEIQTPHPYPNGNADQKIVWSYTLIHPEATWIKLHFKDFYVEDSEGEDRFQNDYVAILDKEHNVIEKFTGDDLNDEREFWALSVKGDTAIIELHANQDINAYGFKIDAYGYGMVTYSIETTCGGDNKENINCITYKPGPKYNAGKPVARLLFQDDDNGQWYVCTGFLIDDCDALLTNNHCIDSDTEAASLEARFDYEYDYDGTPACAKVGVNPGDPYTGDCLATTDAVCDWSLVLLNGCPGAIYGKLTLAAADPTVDQDIYVPQHPDGRRTEISDDALALVTSVPAGCWFGHQADTEGGSSGSPVLADSDNMVYGLHRAGGCVGAEPDPGENIAVKSSYILANLPPSPYTCESTLITLSFFTATGSPDGVTLEWVTESEVDNAGFNLWRAEDGNYVKINNAMIPAEGDGTTGHTYTYVDEDVELGATYYYQLEDIDLHGVSTFHGPISVEWICLQPLSPEDGTQISRRMKQRPSFSWENSVCTAEGIEFSSDAEFSEALSYAVAAGAEEWQPRRRQWASIRKLGRGDNPIYWRVVGLDAVGEAISSPVSSFTLVRNLGRRSEVPQKSGLWGWLKGLVAQISSALEYFA